MQEFIDWISHYNNLIMSVQVLIAGVTAFATVVLVYITWVLARLSKREAYVVGNLESTEYEPRYVNFVIRNTGNATAFDIKVNITPAIPDIYGKPIKGETENNFRVLILPPNQKFSFLGFDSREAPMDTFDVTISWASKPKGKRKKSLTHSIDNRGNQGGWRVKGLDRIARECEKTSEHLKKIEKHLKPPQDKK